MIQIRQGVASSIFLYSIKYINSREFGKYFLWNIIGATFHISALAVIPLYLLGLIGLHKKLFIMLIPVAYCLFFLNLGIVYLIQYIQIDFIQSLWITKSTTLSATENVNLFNLRQLLLICLCLLLWFRIDFIVSQWPACLIYIKIFTVSLVVFILFFDVPDIASRINVIYSITEVFAMPALLYSSRNKKLNKSMVLMVSLIFFMTYYTRFVLP